ncbi:hypothetical protein BO86DRAFT_79330 [Aspergillus japonicus CBS 114.51]|nr:hypothetical protein BO86DRAFT_79330 [Aspergillus japonicus CBS 114.51]RAH87150.1 hypothetical protein BO86DRAFT_79330 [Aspergillus japonicus CBS 114.51]
MIHQLGGLSLSRSPSLSSFCLSLLSSPITSQTSYPIPRSYQSRKKHASHRDVSALDYIRVNQPFLSMLLTPYDRMSPHQNIFTYSINSIRYSVGTVLKPSRPLTGHILDLYYDTATGTLVE